MAGYDINFDLEFDLRDFNDEGTDEVGGSRFADLSKEDLDQIGEGRHEEGTKKCTRWGVRLLKAWCEEKKLRPDFELLEVDDLASLLRRFYGEVRKEDGKMYALRSYRGLRAAIHRHLTSAPHNRQLNIMKDREYQAANNVYIGMLKKIKREGLDISKSKPPISDGDLRAMFETKTLSLDSPSSLLNMTWFYLEYHFCRRGREGLRNLKKSSFGFDIDDENQEFVYLKFNESTKNHPGHLENDLQSVKRMYGTGDEKCPIKAIKTYLSKLNPKCDSFFQRPKPSASFTDEIWYENAPLGVNTLGNMMVKISKSAKLSLKYTNHCVRATTITALSNAGIEARVIMALSSHRNEMSLKSYCSDSSSSQKRRCSSILQSAIDPSVNTVGNRVDDTGDDSGPSSISTQSAVTVTNNTSASNRAAMSHSKLFSKCNFHGPVYLNK